MRQRQSLAIPRRHHAAGDLLVPGVEGLQFLVDGNVPGAEDLLLVPERLEHDGKIVPLISKIKQSSGQAHGLLVHVWLHLPGEPVVGFLGNLVVGVDGVRNRGAGDRLVDRHVQIGPRLQPRFDIVEREGGVSQLVKPGGDIGPGGVGEQVRRRTGGSSHR